MKIRHCEYCGAELGFVEDKRAGDPMVTCGARECQREANYDAAAQQAEARESAEQDNYERYR